MGNFAARQCCEQRFGALGIHVLVEIIIYLQDRCVNAGADAFNFTPTKHLGSNRARLSQIINGKWTSVSDFITD